MDPFQAGVNFLLGRLKQTAIAAWAKFLFEMGFSALGTFLFTCGSVLVASQSWAIGCGSGMIAASRGHGGPVSPGSVEADQGDAGHFPPSRSGEGARDGPGSDSEAEVGRKARAMY